MPTYALGLPARESVFDGVCTHDQVEVVFTNDGGGGGEDRNLYVDYVTVGGTTIQAESDVVKLDRGAGSDAFDGNDVIAGQQGVYWNGALRLRSTAPYSNQQITVRAKGTPAGGVYPTMQVWVNGTLVQTWTVTAGYANYTVSARLDGCGDPATQSYTYYDDTTGDADRWGISNGIDEGAVTMQAQGLVYESGEPVVTTKMGYDAWGNTVAVTDALGYVAETTYESTYHMYPTQACAAVGTSEELCSTTNYYGVNPATISGSSGLPGQVQRVYDANGTDTAVVTVYDAFGRTVKTVRPGDTVDRPTEHTYICDGVDYAWTDGPLMVLQTMRSTASGAGYWDGVGDWRRYHFDGLGRLLQTQAPDGDWDVNETDRHELEQYTIYDALGRAVKESVPYRVDVYQYSTSGGKIVTPYHTPSLSRAHSVTTYDAQGQATMVEAPDGATSTSLSGGRMQVAEDANGHVKLSHSDALGRMTGVDETLVAWSDDFEDGTVTGWGGALPATETGGVMKLTGQSTWDVRSHSLPSGTDDDQAVVFDVKYDTGSVNSYIFLATGGWNTSGYRRWGLNFNSTEIRGEQYTGDTSTHDWPLLMAHTPGTWYRVVFRIGDDGELLLALWERDNPAVRAVLTENASEFAALNWTFAAQVHTGVGYLDDYAELTTHRTTYTYDTLDNLTTVTDTLGNATTMTYDSLGRKVAMTDPDMGRWHYTYDAQGNLLTQIDANKQAIDFYYNARKELTGKIYTSGATPTGHTRDTAPESWEFDVVYAYDESGHGEGEGRRTSMSDASGSTSWTYDTRGRVTQEVKTIDSVAYTTSMTYNSLDQVVTTTYPDLETVTNSYNAAAQPDGVASTLRTYINDAIYNALGQLDTVTAGNGVETLYRYNSASRRLVRLQVDDELSYSYGYDPASADGRWQRPADGRAARS